MSMTYRELCREILELEDDRLDDDVSVFFKQDGQFYEVDTMSIAKDIIELDDDHPFLTTVG